MIGLRLLIFLLFYVCSIQGEISNTEHQQSVAFPERNLLDSGDNIFLMKIQNILKEMNESQSKNEDLNKEILNIYKEIADIKAYIERNGRLLTQFQSTESVCQNDVFELEEEVKIVNSAMDNALSSVNSALEIQVDNLKSMGEIAHLDKETISQVESSVIMLSELFSDLQEDVSEVKFVSDVNATFSLISVKITSIIENMIVLTKSNQKQENLIEENIQRLNNISERKYPKIDKTGKIFLERRFFCDDKFDFLSFYFRGNPDHRRLWSRAVSRGVPPMAEHLLWAARTPR